MIRKIKINKAFLPLFTAIIFFSVFLAIPARADIPAIKNPTDSIQIHIPNLKFSDARECGSADSNALCVNWIGEYIASVYNYGIAIAGIVAAIVLMFGGLIWLTAGGNSNQIGDAKNWIGASITGILLAMTSYIIMQQINPDLISSVGKPMAIGVVSEPPEAGDGEGAGYTGTDPTMLGKSPVDCAKALQSLGAIYDQGSLRGGKDSNNKWHLDCSSLVQKCWKDSGLPDPGGNSRSMYANPKAVPLTSIDMSSLKPGDIVTRNGHAFMCYDQGCKSRIQFSDYGRPIEIKSNYSSYLNKYRWKVIRS
ncbi:hypothetical protein HGA64_04945 [Candidatus Falkowbacteria bacterium]|nr:hypothetical protein [Candidatus Falkowbacteria bacterium]